MKYRLRLQADVRRKVDTEAVRLDMGELFVRHLPEDSVISTTGAERKRGGRISVTVDAEFPGNKEALDAIAYVAGGIRSNRFNIDRIDEFKVAAWRYVFKGPEQGGEAGFELAGFHQDDFRGEWREMAMEDAS